MPKTNQETRQVEELIPTEFAISVDDAKAIVAAIHAAPAEETEAAYAARLAELEAERLAEQAALDAQDPIVYRYIGSAVAGERLVHVPLADIRQSLWDELPPWVQKSVEASDLYTKVDEVN